MLKKCTWLLFALSYLAGCEKNDEKIMTSISGEVSGTLKGGQEFRETFAFVYPGKGFEHFENNYLGQPQIMIRRTNSSGGNFMDLGLVLPDPSYPMDSLQFTSITDGAYQFALQKEVDSQTLMEISSLGFKYLTGVRAISLSANKEYQFVTDAQGNPTYNMVATKQIVTDNICCPNNHCCRPRYKFDYIFTNKAGDMIYYSRIGESIYDQPWEAPFSKIVSAAGIESSTSELYGKLNYSYKSIIETFNEVREPYDRSLLESYNILDEKGVISNLIYDDDTGHLSFDFIIHSAAGNASNSTGHDLQITGHFDSGDVKSYKVLN